MFGISLGKRDGLKLRMCDGSRVGSSLKASLGSSVDNNVTLVVGAILNDILELG